jgi:hypothetical protein
MKLDYVERLGMDNSGFKFLSWNSNAKEIGVVLNGCADWPKAAGLFHSCKLTGVSISATPGVYGSDFYARGSPMVGLLTSNEQADFNTLADSSMALVLSYNETKRKYFSFNGGETGWLSTDMIADLNGRFYAETLSLAEQGNFVWTIKITFYVTFKNAN